MKKLLVGMALGLGLCGATAVTLTLEQREAHAAADSKAMQLARLMLSKDSYGEMLKQTVQGIAASLQAQGQPIPPDRQKKFEAAVAEAMPYDEILQFNTQIYGSRFSDKELDDIIAFYKTPTGSKLIKLMPEITGEAAKKIGALIPQRLPALLKKHGLTN